MHNSEFDPTPSIPAHLRRSLEKWLFSELPRLDATTAIVALSQHIRDSEDQPFRLPDEPIITATEDGEIVISEAGRIEGARDPHIPIRPSLARELQDVANGEDTGDDFRWDLDIFLRGEVEVLMLYEEAMFGHLVLTHGEDAVTLLGMTEEGWFEVHTAHHT